jgi:hypothetical protein
MEVNICRSPGLARITGFQYSNDALRKKSDLFLKGFVAQVLRVEFLSTTKPPALAP